MDFEEREEDLHLREALADLLSAEWSPAHVRRAERGEADAGQLWAALGKLDLLGLLVPEADGGAGGDLAQACAVQAALGEHLCLVPFGWSSMFGATLAGAAAPSEARDSLLGGITSGERPVTAAFAAGEQLRIAWPDQAHAALLVDAAVDDGADVGVPVLQLDGGLELSAPPRSDLQTVGRATLTADAVSALPRVRLPREAFERSLAVLKLSLAAFAVGGQRRLRAAVSQYAMEREQFGRPIGTFQAVAHKCADMAVRLELDSALLDLAVAASANDDPHAFNRAATLAKARATRGFADSSIAALQVFGGHGFSEENDIQLYYRAARGLEATWGVPSTEFESAARPAGRVPVSLGVS